MDDLISVFYFHSSDKLSLAIFNGHRWRYLGLQRLHKRRGPENCDCVILGEVLFEEVAVLERTGRSHWRQKTFEAGPNPQNTVQLNACRFVALFGTCDANSPVSTSYVNDLKPSQILKFLHTPVCCSILKQPCIEYSGIFEFYRVQYSCIALVY